MNIINKIICILLGHKWGFYVHEYEPRKSLYEKDIKDVMYCKRCGKGDLR